MTVLKQLDALEAWIAKHMPEEATQPPLSDLLATLRQLRDQDLEPDPSGGGSRIRKGVATDRRTAQRFRKRNAPPASADSAPRSSWVTVRTRQSWPAPSASYQR